ncbi:uncharacterized protein LOC115326823 [Ixodes scapularis]|uniref:uncharacterized protein LOC115326823 n=1 Tax=Ixodes scapularis TaxID=6945 RepID=UPI001C391B8D|nr:uncharacterized protein LOC115326823 [Ixodes scapularis]
MCFTGLGACMDVATEVEVVADEPRETSYNEVEEMEILEDETASVFFSKPGVATTDIFKPSTSSDMGAGTSSRDAPEGEPSATEVVVEPTDSSYGGLEEMEILEDETGLALFSEPSASEIDTSGPSTSSVNRHCIITALTG